jgi:hypothetical protein
MRSADGRLRIAGPALTSSEKLEILRFVEDVRDRVGRLLGTPFDGPEFAIGLHVRDSEPEDPGGLDVRVDAGQDPPIRIAIRNPRVLQAPVLAERICAALLRSDALARGYRDANGAASLASLRCAPYPVWFGAGVARLLDASERQADAESVLSRWSAAQLPCVDVLADAFSPFASADVALAAQLVAWFLDAPDRATRYAHLRTELAKGTPWTSGLFAIAAGCDDEPGGADTAWDGWLLARRWTVLTPGVTHPGLLARTRDQLRVWPGAPGTPLSIFPVRCPLEPSDLILFRSEPWMPETAVAKVVAMQRLGGGRDEAYRRMAEAYSGFFLALQRRESKRRLTKLLAAAEALLVDLESKAK